MKKMKKQMKLAIEEYKKYYPKLSFTNVAKKYSIERHIVSKYIKNDYYLLFTYENKTNSLDEYLYCFTQEELDFINYYITHPNNSFSEISSLFPNMTNNRKTLYHYLEILGLEKAYIRGLIDGDGWICKNTYRMGFCGSCEMVSYVKNFITENITDITHLKIRKDDSIYTLYIHKKEQMLKIIEFLYKNANIYLDRKYQLYLQKTNELPCLNS